MLIQFRERVLLKYALPKLSIFVFSGAASAESRGTAILRIAAVKAKQAEQARIFFRTATIALQKLPAAKHLHRE